MSPDNDEDNPIGEADSVTLDFYFDQDPETCIFRHSEPMNDNGDQTGESSGSCQVRLLVEPDIFLPSNGVIMPLTLWPYTVIYNHI